MGRSDRVRERAVTDKEDRWAESMLEGMDMVDKWPQGKAQGLESLAQRDNL